MPQRKLQYVHLYDFSEFCGVHILDRCTSQEYLPRKYPPLEILNRCSIHSWKPHLYKWWVILGLPITSCGNQFYSFDLMVVSQTFCYISVIVSAICNCCIHNCTCSISKTIVSSLCPVSVA